MDPVTASAIAITAANAGNAAATGAQNRKSRAFSREMYQQQKNDALTFWNMQNEYNAPEQQMERLRNAGLNPNMLYDKTGAVIPAQNINTPDVQSAQFRTPDFGSIGTGLVQGYFDTQIKQAQYDNLKAQKTVADQEAILKAAQAAGEVSRTTGQGINNTFASLNLGNQLKAAELGNLKLQADIDFTMDSNHRAQLMSGKSIESVAQDILLKKAQTAKTWQEHANAKESLKLLKQDGTLKELETQLRKIGLNPNDPTWMRLVTQTMAPYMNLSPTDIFYKTRQSLREMTGWSVFGKGGGAGGSW